MLILDFDSWCPVASSESADNASSVWKDTMIIVGKT